LEKKVLSPMSAVVGKYVHPNHITAARVPLTAAALVVDRISHIGGATTYAVATLLDWLDGAVARQTNQQTREGAMLDPYVDKITNATALAYIVTQHSENIWLAIAATLSVVLNIVSQAQRGRIHTQTVDAIRAVLSPSSYEPSTASTDVKKISANVWGKIKQIIECHVGGW
jgi:phosphatidylglycerophosphate synthase